MKVRLPLMIQDPSTAINKKMGKMTEGFDLESDDVFLDGPVTRRVAVLDFCPETGKLIEGAVFVPPKKGQKLGKYDVDKENIYSEKFIQVSVFGMIMKTISMFEKYDILGRPVTWAFPAQQLLIVPRAGKMQNAYYERDSHGIQFFFFPDPDHPGKTIYTSLSRDIVAHETGHAILDGIIPDLYNAVTPQSLALHESIADLTALLMSFSSHTLREFVFNETNGCITESSGFSAIAEQFGNAILRDNQPLRSLYNSKTMNPKDKKNGIDRSDPYELSEVLSGALFNVMGKIHEKLKKKIATAENITEFSASGKALFIGSEQFKRMVFRALDYLPVGDVSFADYGRAIIAADQTYYPKEEELRDWIRDEFVKRYMVEGKKTLKVDSNYDHSLVKNLDIDALVNSDWAAYKFADENRKALFIPPGVPFRVLPRLDVTKGYYEEDGKKKYRECIFKVTWSQEESNQKGKVFPSKRQVAVGTTLVIDWDNRKIRSLLTSNRNALKNEKKEQINDRDLFLKRLVDSGVMELGPRATGFDGKPLLSVIKGDITDGILRVRGTLKTLHIAGGYYER